MKRPFRIAASYDTETTNVQVGDTVDTTRAFPVLFIVEDLRDVDLRTYVPTGDITFMRHESEMVAYIEDLTRWGEQQQCVPIVCAYNLLFDLQPLMQELSCRFDMEVSAQSSTHAYTVDLLGEDGKPCLRFWDTFYLEMRGLEAMGETCGVDKAVGDWDYSLLRSPDTPLTDEEKYYAGRDVEVIPAYLRYLLESNEWLEPEMLGVRVLTKTSLVRQMGKLDTGRLRIKRERRKPLSVYRMMQMLCNQEIPKTYAQYALRKACFRGGFTFTAAEYSGIVQEHVYSLDETSAHHAYINGHMVPVKFRGTTTRALQAAVDSINATTVEQVLERYEEPFGVAFHACIRYTNIRLKEGSAFERMGIALLAESKFKHVSQESEWESENGRAAEDSVRQRGWHDSAKHAVFAFGKLMSAEVCEVHVSELEAWCIAQVYDFDSCEVRFGELTHSFVKPPDYVTLLSNLLFERKQACKKITKNYHEGEPYPLDIPKSIPEGIAARLRAGEMREVDLAGYYNSTVKGQFNSIYGTQAQDVFKPSFTVERGSGRVRVDADTVVTPENYEEKLKGAKDKTVLYTYGLRIVGGSRLPLVIGIYLLDKAYGTRVRILGGDTDSMKIATDGLSGDDLIRALQPLHDAVTKAIQTCMTRLRRNFPDYASTLAGVGTFEVEGEAYPLHVDFWNKARISWDGERAHVTCAGLSRPKNTYTLEDWISDTVGSGWPVKEAISRALGWGITIDNSVCHHLEHHRPDPEDMIDLTFTDYQGVKRHVHCHESIALFASDRIVGDTSKGTNDRCVRYLRSRGREVDTRPRVIGYDGKRPTYKVLTEWGWEDMRCG